MEANVSSALRLLLQLVYGYVAYGRCGELQRAFETADELLRLGHPLTAELASFLLQACISDTGEGFRHALLVSGVEVWHKVRSKHVPPSIYLYNLMLRAALDCGAGDIATFEQAMKLIVLAVLGGWTGLLQTMAADGVQPDIRTFSLLLNTMPNDSGQQESLLKTMDALGVQPDVGFFNQLIKKRASYRDTAGAQAAFGELERRQLTPDVASFGCLAMSVSSQRGLDEFMEKLEAANVRPNVEILTTLLNGAGPGGRPTPHSDRHGGERGGPVPSAARRRSFPEWVQKFRLRYAGWLAETEMEPELPQSSQYRPRSLVETVEEGKRVTAGGT
ncbi:Pentatricopeptide repeat-containing protein 1, mitochondrial [Amphibalanus amphitrite]|uniref:Pentatricopeptide repeat-containing protein 1, mitochondrial n=1 Tax=Amphibalanus amphitrite TaxID=1232801 RepID=A0A6A4WBT8_AMPAM|nr:Pentatricopeptide repeat-containing protein 1, mitochondrial [Amphibalanus amphitrite]